ncbi:VIT1/CCC1 transporter family protein [Candidatus Micrarchaeota archaeon]|nr:VIT1/CCC1 transporter family protein [Candidatus Micrarchaeota archaeon]
MHLEPHSNQGSLLRDVILGGQDGLVNVLGIVLGVAAATQDVSVVVIAGLAATFAESVSMGAVAYTSTKAEEDYYKSELEREKREIKEKRSVEVREIKEIYAAKGFKGKLLNDIVKHITSDEKIWLDTMMREELGLSLDHKNAFKSAVVVFTAAFIGSLIPLLPFFASYLVPITVPQAMVLAVLISALTLFVAGFFKAKITIGVKWKSGLEMMAIGMVSALVGYAVGVILGVSGI